MELYLLSIAAMADGLSPIRGWPAHFVAPETWSVLKDSSVTHGLCKID
jgi:hypothetical protein